MNTADIEGHVGNHAKFVEMRMERAKDNAMQPLGKPNCDAQSMSSRWWFASSTFPLVAGTLGPVASAFSICALVRPWRQYYVENGDVEDAELIHDPPWLIAINAIQVAVAIVANLFLLLNMTKRVRFSIAQPITVIGWSLSALCLIGLLSTASGPLRATHIPENRYIWSQAFWFAIWAAILYFVVATIMAVTLYGALYGHYNKSFNLSLSQRTLMLQNIMFLLYLLVGALVFSSIESWHYLDTVYWACVTLFTIGFGDKTPSSTLGRALLIPYALIGIVSIALVIGSIRSLALERSEHTLDIYYVEKERQRMIKKLQKKSAVVLQPIPSGARALTESNDQDAVSEFSRRQREFDLMRRIQDNANRKRRWMALYVSLGVWAVLWLIGALVFWQMERHYQAWGYFDGFYFSFVAFMTLGYGDLAPKSNAGRSFFVFWSLLALPTMTVLISNAGNTVVKYIRDVTISLGNITILPGEHGFKSDLRETLRKLSFGTLFKEQVKTTAPGLLGESQRNNDSDSDDSDGTSGDAPTTSGSHMQSIAQKHNSEDTNKNNPRRRSASSSSIAEAIAATAEVAASGRSNQADEAAEEANSRRRQRRRPKVLVRTDSNHAIPAGVPPTRAEYHLALVKEIERVARHMRDHPNRKYAYSEWSWFLALLGEDEGKAHTHRAPRTSHDGVEESSHDTGTGQAKWSWMGTRSPLVNNVHEPGWVLGRLLVKLSGELEDVKNRMEGEAEAMGGPIG